MMALLLMCPSPAKGQNCIDFTDLRGPNTLCEYADGVARYDNCWQTNYWGYCTGSYNAWYKFTDTYTWHEGVQEDGVPAFDYCRHWVINDPTMTDPHTLGQLTCVPPGEAVSVRLGNPQVGGEAERITYTYQVPTTNIPIIAINYAMVMQNAGATHTGGDRPMFTLVIKANGIDITNTCADLDFNTEDNIGWHYGEMGNPSDDNDDVKWREWSMVSVNLDNYAGQTVTFTFTTYDCKRGAHYGYAYFNIKCLSKEIYNPTCGSSTDSTTLTAPAGFNYMWYYYKNGSTEYPNPSNLQSIRVPMDGTTYYVQLRLKDRPSCTEVLHATVNPRLPLASFSIDKHESCVDTVFLIDESGVSRDGIFMNSPHENVDVVTWDLGDGRNGISYIPGTPITYANDGTYTIRQITRLENGGCIDDSIQTVTVRGKLTKHESMVYDTICGGEKYTWNASDYTATGTYPYVMPNAAGGGFCDSVARLSLKVWDSYSWSDTVDVLEGKEVPYAWHRNGATRNLYTSGVYWDSCHSVHGCDSVYKLVMNVRPKYFFLKKDTICEGESYEYHKNGVPVHYTTAGTYYDSLLTNIYGNDSVYCLQLHVWPKYQSTVTQNFCDGDTVEFHGERFWTDGPHTVHFTSRHGCDSTFTLILNKNPKYVIDTVASISDKQKPYIWHGQNCPSSGTYFDTLHTVAGCDSVIRLKLTIYPTFYQEDAALTLCKDSTMRWHTKYLKGITVGTFVVWDSLKNQYGYDSVYKAQLIVLPSYRVRETAQCRIGDTYYWHGQSITTGGDYYYYGTTVSGCDSIVKLTIAFWPSYHKRDTAYICTGDSYTYHKNNASIVYDVPGTYWDSLKTVHGYDSVYQLTLLQNPKHYYENTKTICQGDYYTWHGHDYTTAGVYWDSLISPLGCDSVFKLTLTVKPRYETHIHADAVEGSEYDFFGTKYTTGGVYSYTFTENSTRCDSTIILELEFHPKYIIPERDTICQGSIYHFHEKGDIGPFTTPGMYTLWDSLKTSFGYDSIFRLQLFVAPVTTTYQSATICQPATYDFFGNTLTTTGVYSKTLLSQYGCDSIVVLNLTVNPAYDIRIDSTICEGQSVMFAGESRTTGGNYLQSLTTVGCGCDSITHLNLTVVPKTRIHHDVHLCTGEYFEWYKTGERITNNRVVSDTLLSPSTGCDSINIWHIYAHEARRDTTRAAICQGDSYNFHGHTYTKTDVGIDTIPLIGTSVHGCDSSYVLILTVNPKYDQTIDTSLCLGDYLTINSKNYDRGGTYYDTLKTAGCGCDSTFTIKIAEYPRYFSSSSLKLCKDSSIVWHGNTISAPGTYYDSLKSSLSHNACDSVYELIVTQQLPSYSIVTATILSTSFYSFGTRLLNAAGTYYDTLTASSHACDSIVELRLTVLPVYTENVQDTICRGQKYNFNGKELENGGLYKDTLLSVYGTDSIVNLMLVVHEPRITTTVAHISDQETYEWHKYDGSSVLLDRTGVYDDSLTAPSTGCDSVSRLQLYVHPTYLFNETAEACEGKPFSWRGNSYSTLTPGVFEHYDALHTETWHYDSIYHLTLTVNPVYRHDTTVAICDGDYYYLNGKPHNTAGTYYDTLHTIHGCDSMFRVTVTIRPTTTKPTVAAICPGEVYTWHTWRTVDRTYTAAGTYLDTLRTKDGKCDSIYYTLSLSMKTPYERTLTPVTLCAGDWYDFFGRLLDAPGDYDTTLVATNGCDSVLHVHVNVNPTFEKDTTLILCSGASVSFNGRVYTSGGNYRDTLTTEHGCDSIYKIRINEVHPFHHTEHITLCEDSTMEWHGQHITGAGTYYDSHTSNQSNNLCDSTYELVVTTRLTARESISATIWSNASYSFGGRLLRNEDIYYDTLHAHSNACDSIVELHLTVLPVYDVTDHHEMCRGESFLFKDTTIETSGVYTRTFRSTVYGTDSIVTMYVTVHEPSIVPTTVHISDQETYEWHKHEGSSVISVLLDRTGVYDDSLKSVVTNCDSINRLYLYVHQTYEINELGETCEGKPFYWRGNPYSTAGDYYDSLKTELYHVDSIYHLTLTVNPVYRHDTAVAICTGGYYSFNGNPINAAGTYYDTLHTIHGCDSMFRVQVSVRPTYTIPTTASICNGDAYTWHTWRTVDRTYTSAGTYLDTLSTKDGLCDSIYYTLSLTVRPTYDISLAPATICANEWYNFCGTQLNVAGDYDTTLMATNGCDSIVRVHLSVYPTYEKDTTLILCSGSSVTFNGRIYTSGGNYRDTLSTDHGCDSVYRIRVNEVHPFYHTEHVELCEDSTMTWHGQTISSPGTYYDSHTSNQSNHLCVSTYELVVATRLTARESISATIWSNASYSFGGRLLRNEGIYYDTLHAHSNACDSIVELHLTVLPVYDVTDHHEMCRGESFLFKDTTIETSGIYTRTFRSTVYGTDSIVTMQVIVHEPSIVPTTVHISDKETYVWTKHDLSTRTLSLTGVYDDSLKSVVTTCDSVNRLYLYVHPTYIFNEVGETCEGKPFTWHGNQYSTAGEYYDSLKTNIWHYDSVYHMTLTVHPVYYHDTAVAICAGDNYNFNGTPISVAGTYYDTIQTIHGCDSMFRVQVSVRPTTTKLTVASICPGDVYTWHTWRSVDRTYTEAGNYLDTLRTKDGLCDSIYYTLSLSLKTRYERTLPTVTICANEYYDFCGRSLNTNGDYDTTLLATNGCDSVLHLHLNVNPTYERDTSFILCTGSVVSFNGRNYTRGGSYRDTLLSVNGCDSVYKIRINEVHPFHHTEHVELCEDSTMEWHGQHITGAGTYYDSHTSNQSNHLCDSTYELVVTTRLTARESISATIWSNASYSFGGRLLTAPDIYYDTLHAHSNACDSIVELHLTVLPVYTTNDRHEMCRGESFFFKDTTITTSGLYTRTFRSLVYGTDSIVTMQVIVHEPSIVPTTVHISDKETYEWHKHEGSSVISVLLDRTGVYDDSLHSDVTGCDSINRLYLYVHPTYIFNEVGETCEGKPFTWRGNQYTVAGDYYDNLKTETWHYDSIYHLTLTVNPIYSHTETINLCEDGHYNFNGRDITIGGVYYDTTKTTCCGCDSTFILRVNIRPTHTIPTTASICKNEVYTWHTWRSVDRTYTEAGNYRDTLRTKDDLCDSIYYTLALNVRPTYDITLPPATICANEWYTFCGKQLNVAGDYDTLLVATNGCDSIVRVHLTVNPTYRNDTTLILCSGSSVSFNGKVYTSGGHDVVTIPTANGCNCDSTYYVFIKECYPFYHIEHVTLCEDSTMEWHGQLISGEGRYYDRNTSKNSNYQCDSTYELVVTVRPTAREYVEATILQTSYYPFGTRLLNKTGIYYDTLHAHSNACDSIVMLNLTVLPVYNVDTTVYRCRGERFTFGGRQLEDGGLYTETFPSSYGTDSVVNLLFVVYEPLIVPTTVHISDKETYEWRKHDNTSELLNLTGVYDDSLTSVVTGCDSINRLYLYVHQTYSFNYEAETCDGTPYYWRGNQYRTSGDYYDPFLTEIHHVDSIYHLNLTVHPTYRHDTTVYLCEGDYYNFNGKPISSAGTYLDTIPTRLHGCDSTFRAQIIVRPTRTIPTVVSICKGESYTWRGKTYTERGDYTDTIRTADGLCDSIYYVLTVNLKQYYERNLPPVDICEGDYYDFLGRLLSEPGDYDTTLLAVSNQCDSVIHLHLNVNKPYSSAVYDTICEGQTVLFGTTSYSASGIYVYEGRTAAGCDSIVTLHLTVIAKQNAYIERQICEGDYVEIDGQKITKSGIYTETHPSQYGCDSITTWRVSVYRPMRDTLRKAICEGDEYVFHGVVYRDPGIYTQEHVSRYNCDSSYVLVLTHNPVYQRDTSLVLCEHDYFTYNGHIYTEGGHYSDTARTKGGCNCDSILNIYITKHPVTYVNEAQAICNGESYTWHGRTLTRASTYYDTIPKKNGMCDSIIYSLQLTVHSDYYDEKVVSICDNSYYLFRGKTLNQSGIYYDSLSTSATGCDSVYCLKLTVNPTYRNIETVQICDMEPYWYNGRWLRETGEYEVPMMTTCGCDSVNILHLIALPTRRDTTTMTICDGESYVFFGDTITKTGIYRDTINEPDIYQCFVRMLDINFHVPTLISHVKVDTICANDERYRMRPFYTGSRPVTYSLTFDERARKQGFVNIQDAPFEDVIEGFMPEAEGLEYIRPDFYKALLTMDNNICAKNNQAQYEVTLLVRYPSWIIEQNWNDVVAVLNEEYNGGFIFSNYEWYVNGNLASTDGSNLYMPQSLVIGDEVLVSLTREGEDYAVPSCPIIIYDKSSELVSEYPVLCGPTEVPGRFFIRSAAEGTYTLYSPLGHRMGGGSYSMGDYLEVQTQTAAGCYLLRLETERYGIRTVKIILR